MSALAAARAERLDLADFLATLTPEQWEHDTLCPGWRVRDVAAHTMSFEEVPSGKLVSRFLRGRLRTDRINELAIADMAGLAPGELVAMIRRHATPTGLGAGLGGRMALVDNMVHQQDVRRPLQMPRAIPTARLRLALDSARWAPLIRGAVLTRGATLVATDLDWSAGWGPTVRGPGEALLMVMAGRSDALRDLEGPGLHRVAARI